MSKHYLFFCLNLWWLSSLAMEQPAAFMHQQERIHSLCQEMRNENMESFTARIKELTDINAIDEQFKQEKEVERTLLSKAIIEQQYDKVAVLLAHGAFPHDIQLRHGTATMLDCALIDGIQNASIITLIEGLLKHGANPNIAKFTEELPLWRALTSHNYALTKLFLDYKANPDQLYTGKKAGTDRPLHFVILRYRPHENQAMIQLLLDYGANPNLTDENGNTALQLAEKWGALTAPLVEIIKNYRTKKEIVN